MCGAGRPSRRCPRIRSSTPSSSCAVTPAYCAGAPALLSRHCTDRLHAAHHHPLTAYASIYQAALAVSALLRASSQLQRCTSIPGPFDQALMPPMTWANWSLSRACPTACVAVEHQLRGPERAQSSGAGHHGPGARAILLRSSMICCPAQYTIQSVLPPVTAGCIACAGVFPWVARRRQHSVVSHCSHCCCGEKSLSSIGHAYMRWDLACLYIVCLVQVPVHSFGSCLRNQNFTGRIDSKHDLFRKYKFCIAMENSIEGDLNAWSIPHDLR